LATSGRSLTVDGLAEHPLDEVLLRRMRPRSLEPSSFQRPFSVLVVTERA
jgi:hypothetical protein